MRSISGLSFTDPSTWPARAVQQYRALTEPRSLMDIFAFHSSEQNGALYMEDAITAAQFLRIRPEEWSTEFGFPCFRFDWADLDAHTERLRAAGYRVWALEKPRDVRPRRTGKVVSISSGRQDLAQRWHKWA